MNQFLHELQNDCVTLLERAILGKDIACFGIDGCGQYGQSDDVQIYEVSGIHIELFDNVDSILSEGIAVISMIGYDATEFGHVATDKNFLLSLNALLKEHEIPASSWEFADISQQRSDAVVLALDVNKLIQW